MDDYKPLRWLGKGSFGDVVEAERRKDKRLVAIKFIREAFQEYYSAKQVLREIRLLRRFSKRQAPGVVKMRDVVAPMPGFHHSEGCCFVLAHGVGTLHSYTLGLPRRVNHASSKDPT